MSPLLSHGLSRCGRQDALKRFGLDQELGAARLYSSVEEAVDALTK
jgi:hypothetical protein